MGAERNDSTGRPAGPWKLSSDDPPRTWREIAQVAALALGEVAYALHRIAGALESVNDDQKGNDG